MGTFEQQQGNRVATFLCYVSRTKLSRNYFVAENYQVCRDRMYSYRIVHPLSIFFTISLQSSKE